MGFEVMRILSILLLLSFTLALPAQTDDQKETGGLVRWLKNLDEKRQAKLEAGLPLFTPFAAPSFSPEFGVTISGGFLYTFKTDRNEENLQRSSIPAAIGISSNGSILASTLTTIYGPRDRYRAYFNAWYRDNPDNYWGVGYDNATEREKDENVTGYQRQWWRVNPTVVFRVAPNVFIGPSFDVNRTVASPLDEKTAFNPVIATDADILADGAVNQNAGYGATIQFDSRDVIQNPYNGMLISVNGLNYGNFLGGDNEYRALSIDYRQYMQFGDLRRVLAWEVFTRYVTDGAPWPELTQIGTPFDLRGYIWGRFRDNAGSFLLAEYRHMLRHRNPNDLIGRFGWVAWAGVGFVSPDYQNHLENAIPNVGGGIRFEVEPRMNVRIDLGFGTDGASSFYISFNEAF